MSVIVAISGGKASAWCADWALKKYPKNEVILYFNDTKWEHPDLYRFLNDLAEYFRHPITVDADGRSPEELFYAHHALANNRMPFCSQELKAQRLQKYYKDGDTLVFGVSNDELHRANRIVGVYQVVATKKNKWPKLEFPLIQENITKSLIDEFLVRASIEQPILYRLGFLHNNCFTSETKFITKDGIKTFSSVVGQKIKVLGVCAGWKDAEIVCFGKQPVVELKLQRYGVEKIINTTAGHRWFVRKNRTGRKEVLTKNLKQGDRLVSMYSMLSPSVRPSCFGIAHGIVFGDGTAVQNTWNNPAKIMLCGDKGLELLKWFPNSPIQKIKDVGIEVRDLPRYYKNFPSLNESQSYLYGWLAGYFAADGCVSGGEITIHSANESNIEFIRDVCCVLGIGVSRMIRRDRIGIDGKLSALYYSCLDRNSLREDFFLMEKHRVRFNQISSRRKAEYEVVSVTPTNRIENVYCAVVPDGAAFTLDENILTGNCSGGCIRAGKKQWKLLYEKLPEVYAERERVEREVREYLKKDVSFFKDETLEAFRGRIERGELSAYYDTDDDKETECIGICSSIA